MGPFLALTLNGFREARRNRVTVVVAVFAIALLLASTLVTNVSITTFDRVLTDVGIGVLSIMLVLLSIYLSSGMLSREIERRTLFLIVSKPISRTTFILGRFAGNMLTLLVLLVMMGAVFLLGVALYGTAITGPQITAIGMLWFELLILSAVGFAVSAFSGQLVSGIASVGAYFAGHLSADIYELGEKAELASLKYLAKGIYYALPNLERLNYRPQATYVLSTPASELLQNAAYAVSYAAVMLVISVILFRRRDFK